MPKSPNATQISRQEWIFVAAIVLAVILFLAAILPHGHSWGGDFAQYINHARNIVEGRPYTDTGFLYYKETIIHAPPNYPPVVPLLLAPIWAWTGIDHYYVPMTMLSSISFALACGFLYRLARRFLPPFFAGAAMLLVATNFIVTEVQSSIGSDWIYLCISLGALVVYFYFQDAGYDETHPWIAGAILGFLLLLGVETRAIGTAMPVAFALAEFFRHWKIRKYVISAGVVVLAGYILFKLWLHYDNNSYADQFTFKPVTYLQFAALYVKYLFANTWINLESKILRLVLVVLMAPPSLIGIWLAWRRPTLIEWYSLVLCGANIVSSPVAIQRYLIPVIPFYLAWTMNGVKWLCDRAPSSLRRPALVSVLALLALNAGLLLWNRAHRPEPKGPAMATFQEMVNFMRNNTASDARIMSWNPRLMALYTRRPGVVYRFENNPPVLAEDLRNKKIDYVLVYPGDQGDVDWLMPGLLPLMDRLQPVFHNSDFTVYHVSLN